MELFSIMGIALVSCVMYVLVKQYKPEYAIMIALASGMLILSAILLALREIMSELNQFVSQMNINQDYIKILLKSLGICYVVELASETCKDAGVTSLASKVELAGKVMIIIISMPLFTSLLNVAIKLMG